ncbi:hypothetical protein [Microbacter margulisiae]|uniref:Uncharacterized protein n=1 Tax=Microbacter margulisiae TaxID=1350067 RepID=A0A7W5H1A9_9PORP|nr:hypothetical protein [Microbacter margulisiae]MBB3186171.1 hypothetical protein [Microbacter margulisiae]
MNWLKSIKLTFGSGTQASKLWIDEAEKEREVLLEATWQIKALSRNERYAKNMELIRSVPGIELITGMLFLTEIEDLY